MTKLPIFEPEAHRVRTLSFQILLDYNSVIVEIVGSKI